MLQVGTVGNIARRSHGGSSMEFSKMVESPLVGYLRPEWSRPAVASRILLAGALFAFIAGLALPERRIGEHVAPPPTEHLRSVVPRSLSSLPLAAQGTVSATLGRGDRAYATSRSGDGLEAHSPAQRLHMRFESSGVSIGSGETQLRLSMLAVGYGAVPRPLAAVRPAARANRVSYTRPRLTEWYQNGPLGLEQGFTLTRAPSGNPATPLTLSMVISGNARATITGHHRSITFARAGGASLRYGDLVAVDAGGRHLHSWLQLHGGRVLLHVDSRGARYPLRIDPLIQQSGKLTGNGEVGGGEFGYGVALSADGNTALAGARSGPAWVFTRSGDEWIQQSELKPSGSGGGNFALSADGNTAVIGAGNFASGSAWVFTRSGSAWSQQAQLISSGSVGKSDYGESIALSADGNTVLVGAPNDGAVGAVWVFTRSGSTWTQQGGKLTRPKGSGAGFGWSVALSAEGNTALIGDLSQEAAWVFARSGSTWTQQGEKLTRSGGANGAEFGFSAALSADGDTALVGERITTGSAWVFTRSGEEWAQQAKLTVPGSSSFGWSVALSADGDSALVGGPFDNKGLGAAWRYTRSGSTWTQQEKLTGAGESGPGELGASVALSANANTALIGGPFDEGAVGAAWAFASGPSVTGVTPATSPKGGGATVSIVGSGFTGASAVSFGSTPAASFEVDSDASITAVSPPGTGTVDVTVSAPDGLSPATPADRLSYEPIVLGVSPNAGLSEGGATVTITGVDLAGVTSIRFGATPAASFEVHSDSSITAVAPTGTGVVDVTVSNSEGTGAASAADRFSYVPPSPPPSVTKRTPTKGPAAGGTLLSITGKNFSGVTAVRFGSVAASFKTNSPTSITAEAPPETAGMVDVTVTTPNGTSASTGSDRFKFEAPTVINVIPKSGTGGTKVTIHGSGFAPGKGTTSFKFASVLASSVECPSTSTCTAVAPSHKPGTVDVMAKLGKGSSKKRPPADHFTYG